MFLKGMTFEFLTFFSFVSLLVISAVGISLTPNPVHAILFLVMVFLNSAGLLILAGAEFLGLVLVVVYVGAVLYYFSLCV